MYEIKLFNELQVEGIYKSLTDTAGWSLNRTSNSNSYDDTFPGFVIKNEQNDVYKSKHDNEDMKIVKLFKRLFKK